MRVLKTDLWDEAKNTRILAWASRQGARAYGIDISEPTVIQARSAFDRGPGARHGQRIRVVDRLRNIDVICEVCDPVFFDKEGEKLRA